MTQEREKTAAAQGGKMPKVDEVIHDARELSGSLRPDSSGEEAPTPAEAGTAPAPSDMTHAGPDAAADHAASAGHDAAAGSSGAPAAAPPPADTTAHGGHTDDSESHAGHGWSGHGEDHPATTLGPIDTALWGASVLGILLGLLMAACFVLAAGGIPTA